MDDEGSIKTQNQQIGQGAHNALDDIRLTRLFSSFSFMLVLSHTDLER